LDEYDILGAFSQLYHGDFYRQSGAKLNYKAVIARSMTTVELGGKRCD
jgi:hypothetical protein